jgi:hypothetical protein
MRVAEVGYVDFAILKEQAIEPAPISNARIKIVLKFQAM